MKLGEHRVPIDLTIPIQDLRFLLPCNEQRLFDAISDRIDVRLIVPNLRRRSEFLTLLRHRLRHYTGDRAAHSFFRRLKGHTMRNRKQCTTEFPPFRIWVPQSFAHRYNLPIVTNPFTFSTHLVLRKERRDRRKNTS